MDVFGRVRTILVASLCLGPNLGPGMESSPMRRYKTYVFRATFMAAVSNASGNAVNRSRSRVYLNSQNMYMDYYVASVHDIPDRS